MIFIFVSPFCGRCTNLRRCFVDSAWQDRIILPPCPEARSCCQTHSKNREMPHASGIFRYYASKTIAWKERGTRPRESRAECFRPSWVPTRFRSRDDSEGGEPAASGSHEHRGPGISGILPIKIDEREKAEGRRREERPIGGPRGPLDVKRHSEECPWARQFR